MTAEEILKKYYWTRNDPEVNIDDMIKMLEEYAQYKVNELNKSDVIKSVCVHQFEDKFYLENGYVETCTKCGIKR